MALVRTTADAQLLVDLFLSDSPHETPQKTKPKDISWVSTHQNDGYLFFPATRTINADIETVWQVVKDVAHYQQFSQGSVIAQNDELEEGKAISFDILIRSCCFGTYKQHSDEIISIVDEQHKVLGWERKFPLVKEPTERYHTLEKSPDDPNKTISRIALRVPAGFLGFFTDVKFKDDIEQDFEDLHEGIQQEAERKANI